MQEVLISFKALNHSTKYRNKRIPLLKKEYNKLQTYSISVTRPSQGTTSQLQPCFTTFRSSINLTLLYCRLWRCSSLGWRPRSRRGSSVWSSRFFGNGIWLYFSGDALLNFLFLSNLFIKLLVDAFKPSYWTTCVPYAKPREVWNCRRIRHPRINWDTTRDPAELQTS